MFVIDISILFMLLQIKLLNWIDKKKKNSGRITLGKMSVTHFRMFPNEEGWRICQHKHSHNGNSDDINLE